MHPINIRVTSSREGLAYTVTQSCPGINPGLLKYFNWNLCHGGAAGRHLTWNIVILIGVNSGYRK